MAMSAAEELELVEEAIRNTLLAQSYQARGRAKQNPNLAALFKRKDELKEQIIYEANGGSMASLAIQTRPT